MPRLADLTGQKFHMLTAIKFIGTRHGNAYWECACDCGNHAEAPGCGLKSGANKSCGCLRNKRLGDSSRTHGRTQTKEYIAWLNMLARCGNRNNTAYQDYGGRGITVCQRWRDSFEAFLADMGQAPSPEHTIDRKDNSGNYEPENCRWATKTEQGRNKRNNRLLAHDGRVMSISQWAEWTGIPRCTIKQRLKRGWSVTEALTGRVQVEKRNRLAALTWIGKTPAEEGL